MVKGVIEAKSFAVVGASREDNKVGHIVFKNLLYQNIKAFPVNPFSEEVLGVKCFKKLSEIKEKIDCVIFAVPANLVADILEETGKLGIKNAVIITAGFSEAGNENLNDKIKKISEKYKINILGPNTLGFINPYTKVNASFSDIMPEQGKIAFISQSGAIGAAILDKKIKLSGFISVGNALNSDFSDFIEYYSNDNNTDVIMLYIESLKENMGKSFIEACKKCKKPIVALKSGKTCFGSRAASSHTAALASEEGVYEGVFKQLKIIEVDSIKELINVSELLAKFKKIGKNALVVTNAGGPGVLCSDYLFKKGINLPLIPEKIKSDLNKILPVSWAKNNPIDILGDASAELYKRTIRILEQEKFYDFIIVLLTPQYMTEPLKTAQEILNLNIKKPVIFCFLGGDKIRNAVILLKQKSIVFDELKDMADVLGKVCG